jgi:hypothetical protein
MSDVQSAQQAQQPKSRGTRPKGPQASKAIVGARRRLGATTKNSYTSPRTLARRKRIKQALEYRESGYSFPQISQQMKISLSTAHGYVVEGLNALPIEAARAVLALELKRLDSMFSAFYGNAVEGDLPATEVCLRIIDRRAKLLGLYPEQGKTTAILAVAQAEAGAAPLMRIEFVVPTKKEPEDERRAEAPPAPPFGWQKRLSAPREMRKDEFGIWAEVE